MKQIYLGIVLMLTCLTHAQQQPFITTWVVGPPVSWNYEITIPTDPDLEYNYSLQLNDNTIIHNITGNHTITFGTAGPHTIKIWGQFPAIQMAQNATENSEVKLRSIEQWGDIQWETMRMAFAGCENLIINATDAPDLSQVTDMSYMFYQASEINTSLNHWDVSNVINMEALFYGTLAFNQPLNNWDVSNVTNMNTMLGYSAFNQPINTWDVSNVTSMSGTFALNIFFNQPLDNWDVSSVTDMTGMFNGTRHFKQPIDNWDVSNVTLMEYMFADAGSFNQPINSWDVSNVTNMGSMFAAAISFNKPLNNWDVSSVTNAKHMFMGALEFNQPLSNWNTENITDMSYMLYDAYLFDQSLTSWTFDPAVDLTGFIAFSGMGVQNYDGLLYKFVQLGYPDKNLGADLLQYCDVTSHQYLKNTLGWTIEWDMIADDCSLAINDLELSKILSVSPVPAQNTLSVNTSLQVHNIDVYDLTGKKVHEELNSKIIDVSRLASGQYFLKIYADAEIIIRKFIKL